MSSYKKCNEELHCYNAQYRGKRKLCTVLSETDFESGKCPFYKASADSKSGDYGEQKGLLQEQQSSEEC